MINMQLEIITEKESSPLSHISKAWNREGRRYTDDSGMMEIVMAELLDSFDLGRDIKTLEVGAGHSQAPSKALHSLGADASTLDADWNKF